MQYEGWLAKQLPRTEGFVKFLQECIRETHTTDREGHPVLVHGRYDCKLFINSCKKIYKRLFKSFFIHDY